MVSSSSYMLDTNKTKASIVLPAAIVHKQLAFVCNVLDVFLWRKRYSKILQTVLKYLSCEFFYNVFPSVCEAYQLSKNHKLLLSLIPRMGTAHLETMHIDI